MSANELIKIVVACFLLCLLPAIAYGAAFIMAYRYAQTLPQEEQVKFWREFNRNLMNDQWNSLCL